MRQEREETHISPQSLKDRLDTGDVLQVVDVREPDEYADWHIPGSVHIPLAELPERTSELPKDADIVIVCLHGSRSERARQFLIPQQYHAQTLAGGMLGWNRVYEVVEVPVGGEQVLLQFRRVGKGCVSYLLAVGSDAIIIDPTAEVDVYVREAASRRFRIVAILDTHIHADHVSGGPLLATHFQAPYIRPTPAGTTSLVPHAVPPRTSLRVGAAVLHVLPTPGHTFESVTYAFGDLFFTGDTLFIDGVGRPDLGGYADDQAELLWETLQSLTNTLPVTSRILPAHAGDSALPPKATPLWTSLGEAMHAIPALRFSRDAFVQWTRGRIGAKPPNGETIKRVNLGLAEFPAPGDLWELEAGPNRCAVSSPVGVPAHETSTDTT